MFLPIVHNHPQQLAATLIIRSNLCRIHTASSLLSRNRGPRSMHLRTYSANSSGVQPGAEHFAPGDSEPSFMHVRPKMALLLCFIFSSILLIQVINMCQNIA